MTSLLNSIGRLPWRLGFLLLTLACLVFSSAQAKQPKPDGGVGNGNTAEGDGALASLTNNTDAQNNTALGFDALFSDTTGALNTATGAQALYHNTTGGSNVATGPNALYYNTSGNSNTATGASALSSNTDGVANTATGLLTLYHNTNGGANTAAGETAMFSNTTGDFNTATGGGALYYNTTGGSNTADGAGALYSNTTGGGNTAAGDGALINNRTGSYNTASGFEAMFYHTSGDYNIALGTRAGSNMTTGSYNINIGNNGVDGDTNTIRIGDAHQRTFIAGIRGTTTVYADTIPVVIDSAGQLGTASSSQRFKKEIRPMDQTSESILKLRPVTFHYKSDTKSTPQFGLIAEEVAAVNPALVARDAQGEIYTVRYDAVNAMLLNEFIREHKRVEQQEATIAQLKSTLTRQNKEMEILNVGLKEQAAQIKKISVQLERNSATQMVADKQ